MTEGHLSKTLKEKKYAVDSREMKSELSKQITKKIKGMVEKITH